MSWEGAGQSTQAHEAVSSADVSLSGLNLQLWVNSHLSVSLLIWSSVELEWIMPALS